VLRPTGTLILTGVVPHYFHRHLEWGLHLKFLNETVNRQYREIVSNAAGEYIDLGGGELPPPGEFVLTSVDVNTTAYGFSTSYRLGKSTHIALGIERENDRFKGTNDLDRSSYETDETRRRIPSIPAPFGDRACFRLLRRKPVFMPCARARRPSESDERSGG